MSEKVKNRHLIWFNSRIQVDDSVVDDWNMLIAPGPDVFWSGADKRFENSTVIFLLVEDNERGMVVPAARQVLSITSDVSLLRVSADTVITEELLERATTMPEALLDIDDEDFATLSDVEVVTQLHPAQDCTDSVFYYGTKIQGRDYLVTSAREMFPLIACPSRCITLIEPQLSMVGFSHSRVLDYFSGAEIELPNTLHGDIVAYLHKYLYFPMLEIYDLLSVWIMGTYIFRAFRYFPYLHLNAEKGSGKTLLMELMSPIAFNGVLMSQPTGATVLQLIAQDSATLFIDEAEGLGSNKATASQLKNILKTGFARSGVYYNGDVMHRTYSPKCFAGINMLDDVLADRTITIRLLRKTEANPTASYRETPLMRKQQSNLRDRLYLFGLQYGVSIAEDYNNETTLYDTLPHLTNRAYDVWVPLFKIVNAFVNDEGKTRVFQSLDVLSQTDARRRTIRDVEENETGLAIEMMDEVLTHIQPLDSKGDLRYYDPDAVFQLLHRIELVPKSLQRKALSRMLKRVLDIDSMPRQFGLGTKRMYVIDMAQFENYKLRYATPTLD
jgi:hypothetical protein